MTKQITREGVLRQLQYIMDSHKPEYGGFHPNTVKTAKDAVDYIERLEKALRLACGSLRIYSSNGEYDSCPLDEVDSDELCFFCEFDNNKTTWDGSCKKT